MRKILVVLLAPTEECFGVAAVRLETRGPVVSTGGGCAATSRVRTRRSGPLRARFGRFSLAVQGAR